MRPALRTGSVIDLPIGVRVLSSPAVIEPGVFGVFRPVLLLPDGITQRLSVAELQGIPPMSLEHIERPSEN
jgi:bla regulator protein blaR1